MNVGCRRRRRRRRRIEQPHIDNNGTAYCHTRLSHDFTFVCTMNAKCKCMGRLGQERRTTQAHPVEAFDTCHIACSFISAIAMIKHLFARIKPTRLPYLRLDDSEKGFDLIPNFFFVHFRLLCLRLRDASHCARLSEAVN